MKLFPLTIAVTFILSCGTTFAQQVTVGTPSVSTGSSFFESSNVSWQLRGPGGTFARFGGPARVPFGGFNPNAGLSGGFGFQSGRLSGALGFNFSQGASRSIVSNTPLVTTFNGVPGVIQSGVQRPFVTGLTPVVGAGPIVAPLPAPLRNERLERFRRGERADRGTPMASRSSSTTTAPGGPRGLVDPPPPTRAEREQQAAAALAKQQAAVRELLNKGRAALDRDKPAVARLYFQMAARRSEGDLKEQALAEIAKLGR